MRRTTVPAPSPGPAPAAGKDASGTAPTTPQPPRFDLPEDFAPDTSTRFLFVAAASRDVGAQMADRLRPIAPLGVKVVAVSDPTGLSDSDIKSLPIRDRACFLLFNPIDLSRVRFHDAMETFGGALLRAGSTSVAVVESPVAIESTADLSRILRQASPYSVPAAEVRKARAIKHVGEKHRLDIQCRVILRTLGNLGRWLYAPQEQEEEAWYFCKHSKQLRPIFLGRDERGIRTFKTFVCGRFGLHADEYRHLHIRVMSEIDAKADGTLPRLFSHYDESKQALYVAQGHARVCRVSRDGVREIDVGDDGIIMREPVGMQAWRYIPKQARESGLFARHLANMGLWAGGERITAEQERDLYTLWAHSVFFGQYIPGKPILALTSGDYRAGKTTLQKLLGTLYVGDGYETYGLRDDSDSFAIATQENHFLAYDNLEGSISQMKWFQNALASTVTGLKIPRRKLYTDGTQILVTPRSWVSINGTTLGFLRGDNLQRCILLPLHPAPVNGHLDERTELLGPVVRNRDAILSEMMDVLSETLRIYNPNVTAFRRHRFTAWANVARAIGQALWGNTESADLAIQMTAEESEERRMRGEPLFEVLAAWTARKNQESVDAVTTFRECKEVAEKIGITWEWSTPRSFGMELSRAKSSLERAFHVQKAVKRSRETNVTYYTIMRREGYDAWQDTIGGSRVDRKPRRSRARGVAQGAADGSAGPTDDASGAGSGSDRHDPHGMEEGAGGDHHEPRDERPHQGGG